MFNHLESYTVSWTPGMETIYHADALKVAEEIASIGENVEPEQIVEKARDEQTELHGCFEWDDSIAAERYRVEQAKDVVRHIYLVRKEPEQTETDKPILFKARAFSHTPGTPGYTQTVQIVKQDDRYQLLLQQAYDDLHAFKRKYECLAELKPIFDLID